MLTNWLDASHLFRVMGDYERPATLLEAGRHDVAAARFQDVIRHARKAEGMSALVMACNTDGMLALIAHWGGETVLEDQMVNATRTPPNPEVDIALLFRVPPKLPDGVSALSSAKSVLERNGGAEFANSIAKAALNWRFQPTSPENSEGKLVTTKHAVGNL